MTGSQRTWDISSAYDSLDDELSFEPVMDILDDMTAVQHRFTARM